MDDLETALDLIAKHPDRAEFCGPRSSDLIEKAEAALGHRFPPTYRQFVSRLGAGNFGSFEIYGVIDDEFEQSMIPDGVWLNLQERRKFGMPSDLLVIADVGNGDRYCLELAEGAEAHFVLLAEGNPPADAEREIIAEDFGAFLLEQVTWQLEDA